MRRNYFDYYFRLILAVRTPLEKKIRIILRGENITMTYSHSFRELIKAHSDYSKNVLSRIQADQLKKYVLEDETVEIL